MSLNIHKEATELSPEEAGYRASSLNKLDLLLSGLVEANRLQCASYMLSRDGRSFAARAIGKLRHTEGSGDMGLDSIRRIASITKLFTVVCVLRLMEEGKLYLNQPVGDWLPEFRQPAFEKVTLYHLLTHTSGLAPDPGYYTEPYPLGWWDIEFAYDDFPGSAPERTPEEETAFRKSQWIKSILSSYPVSEPGKIWRYSSAGFALLGEVISRVSGVHYEDYVHAAILEPLGMKRTFFTVPDELKEEVVVTNDWEISRLSRNDDRETSPPRAGGGLYSTLSDLNRFGAMLLTGTLDGERIISRKSLELMRRDQFPQGIPAFNWGADEQRHHFGLSCSLTTPSDLHGPLTFSHEGAGRSMLLIDPAERFVAVVLVPTAVDWVPESLHNVRNTIWSGLQ